MFIRKQNILQYRSVNFMENLFLLWSHVSLNSHLTSRPPRRPLSWLTGSLQTINGYANVFANP